MSARGRTLEEIAEVVNGRLSLSGDGGAVTTLLIDSRKPFDPAGALFVALKGPRHDGHHHLHALTERGLRHALVRHDAAIDIPGLDLIRVADTGAALQALAAWHRGRFDYPVIGITGSNGKTVVKEWLFGMLRAEEHIVRSPGSWNSQVGVPLSLWQMEADHTLGLFEAGISEPGEMDRLERMMRPTIGVFTNIGPAHDLHFPVEADKAREKARLFKHAHAVVHCADHAVVVRALEAERVFDHARRIDWSRTGPAWLRVQEGSVIDGLTQLLLLHDGREFTVRVPFTDRGAVENALHCIALLLHLGRTTAWITEHIAQLDPLAMRLRSVEAMGGGSLIDDAYSNDLASLTIALDHLATQGAGRQRVVVLGDIADSGAPEARLHQHIAGLLRKAGVHRFIGVGPGMQANRAAYPAGSEFHADTSALLGAHAQAPLPGAITLVKGARTFGLERVVEHWQERSHGTTLTVDHEAVRDNLNHFRAHLGTDTRVMAMLKADGYGSGAVELARLFVHERVAYFGVAYVDEGIALRRAGVHAPVLVMNPEPMPFDLLHRYRLESEVYDRRSLDAAIAFAREVPDAPPVHIELDTGMRRLGFDLSELPMVVDRLREAGGLRVASVMTHLAAAEDPAEDAYTRKQLEDLEAGCSALAGALGRRPLCHAANSAAVLRFPEARLDMVRLGIGLHGISPHGTTIAELRPSVTLSTVIAQVRHIPIGGTVGYNRRFKAERPTTLAVLPIGYADGLPRRAGNGRWHVMIDGRPAPFAGTICMDMCMVDVTGLECRVGGKAVVFGPEHPIEGFAQAMGTIPYELLTGVSPRVKRIHLRA